ncbi:hypothetical protein NKJ81_18700 [Mesorhizobium sp. M0018]|uniref:hypothetical protein n=1 Tax=unclassified Mesorhizobium TaxID=325217 RepID=UPI00333897B6
MKTAVAVIAPLALSGCDGVFGSRTQETHCFSVIPGNGNQPYASVMLDNCTGRTWLLVKSRMSNKPEDGYTYQWFNVERYDTLHPSLVGG